MTKIIRQAAAAAVRKNFARAVIVKIGLFIIFTIFFRLEKPFENSDSR
jgi:hypothetical protein